jgi:hypothetical protein
MVLECFAHINPSDEVTALRLYEHEGCPLHPSPRMQRIRQLTTQSPTGGVIPWLNNIIRR